jgi:hypothetical protein
MVSQLYLGSIKGAIEIGLNGAASEVMAVLENDRPAWDAVPVVAQGVRRRAGFICAGVGGGL